MNNLTGNFTNSLCNNLTKIVSAFKLIKKKDLVSVPFRFNRQLYYAYCFSWITYAIEVYCASSKSYIQKLQIIQNRILKTLYNKDWHTPTKLLHKSLNLLQITDIASLFQLTFFHNHQHRNLPEIFSDYYISRENIHSIFTRNRKQIHIKKTKTNFGSKANKITGAKLYNSLPPHIKESKTVKSFKKNLWRKHALKNINWKSCHSIH